MHLRSFGIGFMLLAVAARLAGNDFALRFQEIRAASTPAQLYAFLYDLPKGGDLHHHFGGSIRAEWWWAIATNPARNGGDTFYTRVRLDASSAETEPPLLFRNIRQHTYERLSAAAKTDYLPLAQLTPELRQEWLASLRLDRAGEGRAEFFNALFQRLSQLSQNPQVRFEALAEMIKAFAAEGLLYLESQFGVEGLLANDGTPMPTADGVRALKARLAAPDLARTGVTLRFQESIVRFRPNAERELERTYAFVDANRDLWVGVNLVGLESNAGGEPQRFLEKFRSLRSRYPGLTLSLHAGEMDGPDSHVRDSLLLGATRIGHGVNLIHDADTMLLLQHSRRVLVEVNLISNRLLEYTPDLTKHPFPEYLRTGIPVCLNTDDRGMWDSNLTDEYFTAVATFNLSWPELVALGRNSLAYSFAPPEVRAKLLAEYEARIAKFEARYAEGSIAKALGRLATVKPVTYTYAKRTWGLVFP